MASRVQANLPAQRTLLSKLTSTKEICRMGPIAYNIHLFRFQPDLQRFSQYAYSSLLSWISNDCFPNYRKVELEHPVLCPFYSLFSVVLYSWNLFSDEWFLILFLCVLVTEHVRRRTSAPFLCRTSPLSLPSSRTSWRLSPSTTVHWSRISMSSIGLDCSSKWTYVWPKGNPWN